MKLAKASALSKVEIPMAPMIDIVFQLLIFFMLNLRIIAPEGNFNINLPVSAPAAQSDQVNLPSLKIILQSDRDGNLSQVMFNQEALGNDDAAFERLNSRILTFIGRPGNPNMAEIEAEIDADFECQYKYTVKALSRITGRMDPQTHQVARYIEKIKFAPPHKPKG